MKILHDMYMVAVDQEFEEVRMKSGLHSLNAAYFEDDQESKYRFKKQSGYVVNVPDTFTDKIYDIVDPGIPQPRKFIPSEFLAGRRNEGYTKQYEYNLSTFDDYETITMADIGKLMDVQVGDKVYFDYTMTDKEHYLGRFKEASVYGIPVPDIYCAVRKVKSKVDGRIRKRIFMQGGWVLVEPDMESWDEIKTEGGLLKQPKPNAKQLVGFVREIRNRPDLKAGDHIVYIRNADYVVVIERRSYFVMRESDILCQVI